MLSYLAGPVFPGPAILPVWILMSAFQTLSGADTPVISNIFYCLVSVLIALNFGLNLRQWLIRKAQQAQS